MEDLVTSHLNEVVSDVSNKTLSDLLQSDVNLLSLSQSLSGSTYEFDQASTLHIKDMIQRIERLLSDIDTRRRENGHDFLEACSNHGEKKVSNTIELCSSVYREYMMKLSRQLNEQHESYYNTVNTTQLIQETTAAHFETLKTYYTNIQAKLNSSSLGYESTYRKHELESLSKLNDQLLSIKRKYENDPAKEAIRAQTHEQADELTQQFYDKVLELSYRNHNMEQDYLHAVERVRRDVCDWKVQTTEEMEERVRIATETAEDTYLTLVEELQSEVESTQHYLSNSRLEAMRIQQLAATPPFARREALVGARNNNEKKALSIKPGNTLLDWAVQTRMSNKELHKLFTDLLLEGVTAMEAANKTKSRQFQSNYDDVTVVDAEKYILNTRLHEYLQKSQFALSQRSAARKTKNMLKMSNVGNKKVPGGTTGAGGFNNDDAGTDLESTNINTGDDGRRLTMKMSTKRLSISGITATGKESKKK